MKAVVMYLHLSCTWLGVFLVRYESSRPNGLKFLLISCKSLQWKSTSQFSLYYIEVYNSLATSILSDIYQWGWGWENYRSWLPGVGKLW